MSMDITLQLDADLERRLRDEAARRGQTVEQYLERLIEGSLPTVPATAALSAEEWIAQLRAWAASHTPAPVRVDDSRESIYADRAE
jgi:hypothetical protein